MSTYLNCRWETFFFSKALGYKGKCLETESISLIYIHIHTTSHCLIEELSVQSVSEGKMTINCP